MTDSTDLSWAENLFADEPWLFHAMPIDSSIFQSCAGDWDMASSILDEGTQEAVPQASGCDALDPLLFLQQDDSNGAENGVPTPADLEVEAPNRLDMEQVIHGLQRRVDALEDKCDALIPSVIPC